MLSFGPRNLLRSLQATLGAARVLHQLGGAAKALAVTEGVWRLFDSRIYLVAIALVALSGVSSVATRRAVPSRGDAGACSGWRRRRRSSDSPGYVLVYALVAPYLFLFVPASRRETGARLLIWVWASSMMVGAMTAYSSSFGFRNGAVGVTPALFVSGLFLAWSLEAAFGPESGALSAVAGRRDVRRQRSLPWLALVVLIAVLGVTISFQFQFQQVGRPYGDLTSRFDAGPWWGIAVEPEQRSHVEEIAADLARAGASG